MGKLMLAEVKTEIEKIALSDPDMVAACNYLEYDDSEHHTPTGPCCIVGTYLVNLGVPMEVLESFEGQRIDTLNTPPSIRDMFDSEAMDYLAVVQNLQDEEMTWGEAVEQAGDM